MDRNLSALAVWPGLLVALRKESVDRNSEIAKEYIRVVQSLSARRAWIEIDAKGTYGCTCQWSLSARRAWIEIGVHCGIGAI